MPDYSSMWAGLRSSLSPGDGESMYSEAEELPTTSADGADTGAREVQVASRRARQAEYIAIRELRARTRCTFRAN